MKSQLLYDVFVTSAQVDKPIADTVIAQLELQGLSVASADRLKLQKPRILSDLVRDTIAECSAVVAIVGPQSVHNPNVMFEIGAAFAWNKACFLIVNGLPFSTLPASLTSVHKYSLSEIDKVAKAIQDAKLQLSDADVEALALLYHEVGVPVDKLILRHSDLSRITRDFNGTRDRALSPELLLQHLLRLRKQGRLAKSHS